MAFFDEFSKKISGTARNVQDKTRDGIEVAKITGEIRTASSDIEKLYLSLGKMYFEKKAPDELETVCNEITALNEKIESLNARKDRLRQQSRCPGCGAATKTGAKFCPNCGTRLPEIEPEAPAETPADKEFCKKCGAAKRPGMKFCTICGTPYSEEDAPAVDHVEIHWPPKQEETKEEPTDSNE